MLGTQGWCLSVYVVCEGAAPGCVNPNGWGKRASVGRRELCLSGACGVCCPYCLLNVHRWRCRGRVVTVHLGWGGMKLGVICEPGSWGWWDHLRVSMSWEDSSPRAGPHVGSCHWVGELGGWGLRCQKESTPRRKSPSAESRPEAKAALGAGVGRLTETTCKGRKCRPCQRIGEGRSSCCSW